MKLNDEQEIAASHKEGPCLVTACPGSGKSRVIVERTARLIQSGIPASSILCITFTNKASNEMRERIEKYIGDSSKQIFIATFHKLAASILRFHGHHLGYGRNVTILDDDGQVDLMSQTARQLGYEFTKPQINQILWALNDSRENMENDDQMFNRYKKINENFYPVGVEYIKRLHASNCLDFSSLLSETIRLFTEFPTVLQAAQNKWKYFQVDEVQDTNYAQFKIIEMLSAHTKNVFVVGDLDQTIYSWRGARVENIRDFTKLYPDTKVISLGKNYRSTPEIIKVADKLIKFNTDRIAAPFVTDNPSGPPVKCSNFADDKDEAKFIAETVQKMVNRGECRYDDVAIFYRTNNMSRAIEMAMINNNIPHTLIGGFSFFDRREVKDCLSMLKFLVNPLDGVSFHRFCNKPKRALGDVTVGKIEIFAKNNSITLLDAMKQINISAEGARKGINEIIHAYDFDFSSKTIAECLSTLVSRLKYKDYLNEDSETALERIQNVEELIKDAARYGSEYTNSISSYLEHIALLSAYDKDPEGDSVSLMSGHASKGLEFPVVFLVGFEQNILPHQKAVTDRADGIEEERRLAYVMMTRAEKHLFVSYCQKRMDLFSAQKGSVAFKKSKPSQFLYEAGLLKLI